MLFEKAKDRYHNSGGKEKGAEYYINDEQVLKGKTKNKYINMSEEEKGIKRAYGRYWYRNMEEK